MGCSKTWKSKHPTTRVIFLFWVNKESLFSRLAVNYIFLDWITFLLVNYIFDLVNYN